LSVLHMDRDPKDADSQLQSSGGGSSSSSSNTNTGQSLGISFPIIAKYLPSQIRDHSDSQGEENLFSRGIREESAVTIKQERHLISASLSRFMIARDSFNASKLVQNASRVDFINRASTTPCTGGPTPFSPDSDVFVPAWRRKACLAIEQAKNKKKGKFALDLDLYSFY
jgi:hypothetical protein